MRKQELTILIGVIILLAFMFLVYVVTLFFAPQKPNPSPFPSLSPNSSLRPFDSLPPRLSPPPPPVLPNAFPQPTGTITKEEFINLMPQQTEFANIEYLSTGDAFAVTIKKNPYQENKQKVEKWFLDQGINPSDLNIYWQTYPEVITE